MDNQSEMNQKGVIQYGVEPESMLNHVDGLSELKWSCMKSIIHLNIGIDSEKQWKWLAFVG